MKEGGRRPEAPLLAAGGVRTADRGEEVPGWYVLVWGTEMAVAFEITDEASLPEEPGRSNSSSTERRGGSGDREAERSGETVTGERSISGSGRERMWLEVRLCM